MKRTIIAITLLLFHAFQSLEGTLPLSKVTGDELYFATCFAEAVEVYKKLLDRQECDHKDISVIHYRVGHSYYMLKQYDDAAKVLEAHFGNQAGNFEGISKQARELYIQALELAGICYRKAKNYDKSSDMFDDALLLVQNGCCREKNELLFEKGVTCFESKNYELARHQFLEVRRNVENSEISTLAGLFLARTEIAQHRYADAEKTLLSLDLTAPITFEVNFVLGEINYFKKNYSLASRYFEKSLPEKKHAKALWAKETLLYLGSCYLKLAADSVAEIQTISQMLDSTEYTFKKSLELSFDEESHSGLMQCYRLRSKKLNDRSVYELAKKALDQAASDLTIDRYQEALLTLAELAPTHKERDTLLTEFIHGTDIRSPHYSKGWYRKGLNNLEEARKLLNEHSNSRKATELLENAASELQNAFDLLKDHEGKLASLSMFYACTAYYLQGTTSKREMAFHILYRFTNEYRDLLNSLDDPDEVYYFLGKIGGNLFLNDEITEYFEKTIHVMNDLVTAYPLAKRVPDAHLLMGKIRFQNGNYSEAEANFSYIIENYPDSPLIPESLFWTGKAKKKQNADPSIVNQIFRRVYTEYEKSPYAAEAYFSMFTFKEYLQGSRHAAKHLQGLVKKFPDSPLAITSYYLLGTDYKKDRKSTSGRWIRKRNLPASIESYQSAIETFDKCYQVGSIPEENLKCYTLIRYRSLLEKGIVNLAVANESQGTKKLIYLDYAERIFSKLIEELEAPETVPLKLLTKRNDYIQLFEEASYSLAITYVEMLKKSEAEKTLMVLIDKCREEKITRGYYLSRAWYRLGLIAMSNEDYLKALEHFGNAEDTSKGNILSADERLELMIQESYCHRYMDRLDLAMLILSKVINDNAVSYVRVKAMYLRAELYEQQGRYELAGKQLEATAKKGGPWALKAKTKLAENYGYL